MTLERRDCMAPANGKTNKSKKNVKKALIDPVYRKFCKNVIRSLASTDFYDFFMSSIEKADNEFQFSNRKMEKTIDIEWIEQIENAMESIQNIIAAPRQIIKEEEIIVNVAHAKRTGSDVVRHLAQHGSLIEDFDAGRGTVRPAKLMQKIRDESTELYENRLAFTVLEKAAHFVQIRYDALFAAMSEEFGAKLKLCSDMDSATEHVHMDMYLHIKDTDSALETDDKNKEVFERISRLHRLLNTYMGSEFAHEMSKLQRINNKVIKTNVLKRNPDYKEIMSLFEFLKQYDDVGYAIKITEQNPEIDEIFKQNIYHNILFNYVILKGYLEDEKDRELPVAAKGKKKALKPKFIKEIIEELTEDYDLPEVEVRKVLIEQLTKEQLMQEEAEERRRLVEEQERLRKEEEERLQREKEAEEERLRILEEEKEERLRQEAEAERERLRQIELEQKIEDKRQSDIIRKEIEKFTEELEERIKTRNDFIEKERKAREEYEKNILLAQELERLRQEEKLRKQKRKEEEKERIKREKLIEKERKLALAREEKQRILEEQAEKDYGYLAIYIEEIEWFYNSRNGAKKERVDHELDEKEKYEVWKQERLQKIKLKRDRL